MRDFLTDPLLSTVALIFITLASYLVGLGFSYGKLAANDIYLRSKKGS